MNTLPARFHVAWIACCELVAHLPHSQELDDSEYANAVLRYCEWARDGSLKAAVMAVRKIAHCLGEPSATVKLIETSEELFAVHAPERPRIPVHYVVDRKSFEIRRILRSVSQLQSAYEAAIRTRLADSAVRDRSRMLLQFDPEGLLDAIAEELRKAASTKSQQTALPPIVDPMRALTPVASGDSIRADDSREDSIQSDSADSKPKKPVHADADPTQNLKWCGRIPSENRTRPMSLQEAACLMGYKGRRADRQLRSAIDDGGIVCEKLTRQQFIFDRRQFPEGNLHKVVPTGSK
jgi:hypothetical protein